MLEPIQPTSHDPEAIPEAAPEASSAQSGLMQLEDAVAIVLEHTPTMPLESVSLLDVVGRVSAQDQHSDIDVAPFAHAAMDGYALRSGQIAEACADAPISLKVIAEAPAGTVYDGPIAEGECVRIMTGAPVPAQADSVVKYEIVAVEEGDGHKGSTVSFNAPTQLGSNIRKAGEEAKAGDLVMGKGEVVGAAGVGFLASCGVMQMLTYQRPRVAVIATGSELVDPSEVPPAGKIRNSNALAMAACVKEAGGIPTILPIVPDTFEALEHAISQAAPSYDVVIITGGAANGDFDFTVPVLKQLGQVFITAVNMRPGKAQSFALVEDALVFGLPGNPAAAYCGFQMIIRPALRKMQGYAHLQHPVVSARLASDVKKKDPRRIYLRAVLTKDGQDYMVEPAKNQSSGLFSVIQRTNCLAVMPEGQEDKQAGDMVECVLLDIPEEFCL